MSRLRHVLGISGGKDSAALAIYLKQKYPELNIEYYTADTGKELKETYQLISNLESYLGKKITVLNAAANSPMDPFDHFLDMYGGFLPSTNARWCTKKLKLEPFENFVGNDPVISYVGIRGDENRDGYISKRANIQSIFPFRRNIWSEDVIGKCLANSNIQKLTEIVETECGHDSLRLTNIIQQPISDSFSQKMKLSLLLDISVKSFNRMVFTYLKYTKYPLAQEIDFPLLENDEVLIRDDIFRILEDSGVGVPAYYKKTPFELDQRKGYYSRTRSGCYFCFYQQKIEWVWLYENHPKLFQMAMAYEKDGYSWQQDERLEDLIKPERINQIKSAHFKKSMLHKEAKSTYLVDLLDVETESGCASCFI